MYQIFHLIGIAMSPTVQLLFYNALQGIIMKYKVRGTWKLVCYTILLCPSWEYLVKESTDIVCVMGCCLILSQECGFTSLQYSHWCWFSVAFVSEIWHLWTIMSGFYIFRYSAV